jgi:hypothetical protein
VEGFAKIFCFLKNRIEKMVFEIKCYNIATLREACCLIVKKARGKQGLSKRLVGCTGE